MITFLLCMGALCLVAGVFHCAAYSVTTVANTPTNGVAIQDDILTRNPTSGNFILPDDEMLFLTTFIGATAGRCQINSATLRQVNLPYIRPSIVGAHPYTLCKVQSFLDQPLRLPKNEEIAMTFTSTAAEAEWGIMWLGQTLEGVPAGDILTCRWTNTTATAVAGSWTTIQMTLDQILPPGTYAVVGSEVICASGLAHRLIIPNQYFRPGALSMLALGSVQPPQFMDRELGSWGTFMNFVLPQVQVLCTAADATFEGYMQLVKVG